MQSSCYSFFEQSKCACACWTRLFTVLYFLDRLAWGKNSKRIGRQCKTRGARGGRQGVKKAVKKFFCSLPPLPLPRASRLHLLRSLILLLFCFKNREAEDSLCWMGVAVHVSNGWISGLVTKNMKMCVKSKCKWGFFLIKEIKRQS